jgi:PIN domain nuclease of toxin-antitoxin system
MRLLLDSHTVIWFIEGNPQLGPIARSLIEDSGNEKWMSLASVWEIAIKLHIGKLSLGVSLPTYLSTQVAANGIQLLPISLPHILHTLQLPLHHRDPFDRLLIAQSLHESMPLVSADSVIDSYGCSRYW